MCPGQRIRQSMIPGRNTSSAIDTAGGSGVSGGDEREGQGAFRKGLDATLKNVDYFVRELGNP